MRFILSMMALARDADPAPRELQQAPLLSSTHCRSAEEKLMVARATCQVVSSRLEIWSPSGLLYHLQLNAI